MPLRGHGESDVRGDGEELDNAEVYQYGTTQTLEELKEATELLFAFSFMSFVFTVTERKIKIISSIADSPAPCPQAYPLPWQCNTDYATRWRTRS